jgi:pilus assembly protein CpaE
MAAPKPKAAAGNNVLVLAVDPESRRRLGATVRSGGRFTAIEADANTVPTIGAAQLHAVILDLGPGDLLDSPALGQLRDRMNDVPLIVVSEVLSADRARQLVKLRVFDWLQQPVVEADIINSLTQIASGAHPVSRVTTFVAASGGAGATTMALLAARHLGQKSRAGGTCVVDLDFQSANAAAYLNTPNEFDLDALIASPDRLDAELMELMKREPSPGVTLYSFERPNLYFDPRGREFVLRLLDLAAGGSREVIVDLPNLMTPWFEDVVRNSDQMFIVFELNVASLGHARRTALRLAELRGGSMHLSAIANKAEFKLFGNVIARKDVEKMLPNIPLHTVASDPMLLLDAVNRGLLPTDIAPRSRLVREATQVFASAFAEAGRGR